VRALDDYVNSLEQVRRRLLGQLQFSLQNLGLGRSLQLLDIRIDNSVRWHDVDDMLNCIAETLEVELVSGQVINLVWT
jgi:hypothetical protein